MDRNPLKIYRDKSKDIFVNIFFIAAPLIAIIFYRQALTVFCKQHIHWALAIGYVYLVFNLSIIIEQKREPPKITMYDTGIWFDKEGFFNWEMIESFKTIRKKTGEKVEYYLVLVFKEYADMKINISHLDKTSVQIADAILYYQNTGIVFIGHLLHNHE
jgi:hypothetical protein